MELLGIIVYALALKEYNGISAVKRSGHEALSVIRSGREAGFQTGNMRNKSRPILAVLRAVFGAHADAQNHRHFELAGSHSLPFSHLVEHFVSGASQEIAIHKLYH